MKSRSCNPNMHLAIFCVFTLFLRSALAEKVLSSSSEQKLKTSSEEQSNEILTRRQDNGFSLMDFFLGNQQHQQNQQQAAVAQQQARQAPIQQALPIQRQLQQLTPQQLQQLTPQQLQQLQQLYQLQQQQLLLQQQGARGNEVYQDNTVQQQQQQVTTLNRDGGYGQVGLGGSYGGGYSQPAQQPKQIGISIGGGKPPNVIGVGNILTLLPRIINVLSAGGKVMFGVELGNNFYFGPVGAKPLYG